MKRAFTLIEVIAATAILGFSIYGGLAALRYALIGGQDANRLTLATVIARSELDKAAVWGWNYLPTGTINSVSPKVTGQWTGAFDATLNSGQGGWTSGGTTCYDATGAQTTSSSSTARFKVTDTIVDGSTTDSTSGAYTLPNQVLDSTSGTPAVGHAYALDFYAVRTFTVTVKDSTTGTVLFQVPLVLVKGGV